MSKIATGGIFESNAAVARNPSIVHAPRVALALQPTPPMQRRLVATLWLGLAACDDTVSGQQPVGGNVDTEAEIQRYLRRAYLDLTGHVPTDADLTAATARLQTAGNTPTARGELVAELVGKDAFATVWIAELENGIFGGNTFDQQYQLVCGIIRGTVPACTSCTATDSCA